MPSVKTFKQSGLFLWTAIANLSHSSSIKDANDCPGYRASNVQISGSTVTADLSLAGSACNIYGDDLTGLKFLAEYQTDSRLHVMIYDTDENVYQVPESVLPRPGGTFSANESLLTVSIEDDPFSFTITRRSNNEVLFSTAGSSIVFESTYLRLQTSLPEDPVLYGLGEHTDSLRLPTSKYVRTIWNRDAGGVPAGTNLYGTHPVYYEYRPGSNNTHGVLFLNSNGMDIKIDNQTGQILEYNTLGGVFDFYFIAGPDPFDVSREYSEITQKAAMQSYWALGFHQCRWGYSGVDELAQVVANYSSASIPLETMWTDIDYMDHYKVFSLGENFPLDKMRSFINNLHRDQQHYIVMVDPAVAYQDYDAFNRGVSAGAFIKTDNGSIYKAVVWPGVAAYPDWFNPNTQDYWNGEFGSFFSASSGVDIDALWIDMNEPSNFCVWPCDDPDASTQKTDVSSSRKMVRRAPVANHTKIGLPGRNLTYPLYTIKNNAGIISNKTARTDLIHSGGWAEYDTHNLYGTMMSSTSRNAMLTRRPNKRPLIITRSTYVGAGAHVGHWLGDNNSAWDQLQTSIRHMLQFAAFFQVPMVGADVCGFLSDTTEELCARWMALGAWYPFYRNHNVAGAIPQEAYRWKSVATVAKAAIEMRYRLLDYIYSALHKQTVDGTPLLSPLWMNYPQDNTTHAIQLQYFYGPSILVNPVTEVSTTSVTFYLPKGIWYDLYTHQKLDSTTGGYITYDNVSVTSPAPALIRGGSIIPMRLHGANTTTELRNQQFELIIAPDGDDYAAGRLYLDDGESLLPNETSEIEFVWQGNVNTSLVAKGTYGYDPRVGISRVTVLTTHEQKAVNLSLTAPWTWVDV